MAPIGLNLNTYTPVSTGNAPAVTPTSADVGNSNLTIDSKTYTPTVPGTDSVTGSNDVTNTPSVAISDLKEKIASLKASIAGWEIGDQQAKQIWDDAERKLTELKNEYNKYNNENDPNNIKRATLEPYIYKQEQECSRHQKNYLLHCEITNRKKAQLAELEEELRRAENN